MEIVPLKQLDDNVIQGWGHNGYVTRQVYEVVQTPEPNNDFIFKFTKVDREYIKNWETSSENIREYNEIIKAGHSFGAFDNDKLIGMIICESREWNNTLYIENILVAEQYRGQQVGKKLMEKIIAYHNTNGFRLIELETQNTNVPAIDFYLKQGFNITGINLKLYNDNIEKEVAFFMTYENPRSNN